MHRKFLFQKHGNQLVVPFYDLKKDWKYFFSLVFRDVTFCDLLNPEPKIEVEVLLFAVVLNATQRVSKNSSSSFNLRRSQLFLFRS
jgi:hypothetical protein